MNARRPVADSLGHLNTHWVWDSIKTDIVRAITNVFGFTAILDLGDHLTHVIHLEISLFIFLAAYKHADGKKIDGRRVLVDVERARTVKGWRPRRLGKCYTCSSSASFAELHPRAVRACLYKKFISVVFSYS